LHLNRGQPLSIEAGGPDLAVVDGVIEDIAGERGGEGDPTTGGRLEDWRVRSAEHCSGLGIEFHEADAGGVDEIGVIRLDHPVVEHVEAARIVEQRPGADVD
jgi:hypothetical protein